MAGGPIFPFSSYPGVSSNIYPGPHIGNSNSRVFFGMSVVASLGADSTWEMQFKMPEVLPSGIATLALLAVSAKSVASTNIARVNPTWGSAAIGEDYDALSLTAEGVQSVTWGVGNIDEYLETQITLDADTVVASEIIVMNMVFETASWDLDVVSTWQAYIIWV